MTVAAPYANGRTRCKHHDVIAPPNGLISKARCKKCGRVREYLNYRWPDYNEQARNE